MNVALSEARAALVHGDVPVGAVVVDLDADRIVAAAPQRARAVRRPDRTRRAPRPARRRASALGRWRLDRHALVVTLEPCPMCAGAVMGRARAAPGVRCNRPEGGRERKPLQLRGRPPSEPHDGDPTGSARGGVCGAAQDVLRRKKIAHRSPNISPRRDARAAESDGLENHCGASHRGFKSHSLRHCVRVRAPRSCGARSRPVQSRRFSRGRFSRRGRGCRRSRASRCCG